jgi:hypothetical protein
MLDAPEGSGANQVLTFDAVTTYAQRHWDEYAHRCIRTFDEHWRGVVLHAVEDAQIDSDWLDQFKRRHAWRPTVNYRFDAVRFAHKVAVIESQFFCGFRDAMVWMDADCVTHAKVDPAWLSELLGDADFAYLKRGRKYSETGFMIFRRSPACAELIRSVADLYRSDELFALREWHDCMAFDTIRERMEREGAIKCVSLSGDAENTSHPLVNGPLGARLDHCKGRRKAVGKSLRSDLTKPRQEAYWNG